MLEKYRNIILGVGIFIIFILVVQLIFVKSIKAPQFSYATYKEKQEEFNVCYADKLAQKQVELQAYKKVFEETKDAKEIKQNTLELLEKNSCSVTFVSQNDDQIRDIAKQVVAYAQELFNEEGAKLLNTVYTTDEQFSAILQEPRSYLFYGISSDEKTMVGLLATPQEDGTFIIKPMWDKELGNDEAYTQNEVSKLLLVYNQKVF